MSQGQKRAAWRKAVTETERTEPGSVARQDAERRERRAEWAYEDGIRADYADGGREPGGQRRRREAERRRQVTKEAGELRIRGRRLADESEFQRELDEPES